LEKNIYNKVIGNVLRGLAQVIVWLGVVIAWIREAQELEKPPAGSKNQYLIRRRSRRTGNENDFKRRQRYELRLL
jgi:hypothetical protein